VELDQQSMVMDTTLFQESERHGRAQHKFQELQTCSDVSRFLKKDGMCIEEGRRVPEKWFYTDHHAKERSMTMNARDFGRGNSEIMLKISRSL